MELGADNAAVLAKFKWDQPRFIAALNQVQDLRAANQAQEAAKGGYEIAMNDLSDQIDALAELFRPLAKNTRSALRDIRARKTGIPSKPQRPVPTKARKKTTIAKAA